MVAGLPVCAAAGIALLRAAADFGSLDDGAVGAGDAAVLETAMATVVAGRKTAAREFTRSTDRVAAPGKTKNERQRGKALVQGNSISGSDSDSIVTTGQV